ncbi:MAG TPA: nucleoside kinase [Erysipelotrichaceae bacterium]|nr:nucleoside kinase [Erysipelotrichaceae bacterium]
MKITIVNPQNRSIDLTIEQAMHLEEIIRTYGVTSDTPVAAALCDQEYIRLDQMIDHSCTIFLKDVKDGYGNMSLQYSLSLLYRCAVKQVVGRCDVQICNSLSKGLFTRIIGINPTDEICHRIEEQMRLLVEKDIVIKEEYMEREPLLQVCSKDLPEVYELVNSTTDVSGAYIIEMEGVKDYCPIHVLPSTGDLQLFEVRRYRNGILLRFPDMNDPCHVPPYSPQAVLYNAFAEETKWDRLTGISGVSQLNRVVNTEKFDEVAMISDALHERKIAEIASMIKKEEKRIILIAGPSSSGKTSFAKRLCIQLRVIGMHPLYLGTDDYFVDRKDLPKVQGEHIDYEALSAVDTELFSLQMTRLLGGDMVDLPYYDFKQGKKIFGKRITSVRPGQPIVIEGIHGLNPALTEMLNEDMKLKIYVSPLTSLNIDSHHRIPTSDVRILRRMIRDYRTRGNSPSDTILSWHNVRAGEEKNIFPYCGHADVFFNTQCTYEVAVLKHYATPLLQSIDLGDPAFAEAQRILTFLQYFNEAQDDHAVLSNSILREFIGGSILVK